MSLAHAFIRHLMVYIQKVKEIWTAWLPFSWLMLIVNLCLLMLVSVSDLIEVIYHTLDRAWKSVFWEVFKWEWYRSNTFLLLIQTSDIFHTVKFAYHKMKDAKLGASMKLRKKEIFEGGWGILEF